MIRIGFFSSVGTGKDTIGRLLANRIVAYAPVRGKRCKVRHIQEFSVLWHDKTGNTTEIFEQAHIFHNQKSWDHDYDSRADDPYTFIVCSAPAPLAYFYTLAFADITNPKHLELLADLYRRALKEICKYNVIFYMPIEFDIPKGDRLRKPEIRNAVDKNIHAFLLQHHVPFITLSGSEEKRAKKAFAAAMQTMRSRLKLQPHQ